MQNNTPLGLGSQASAFTLPDADGKQHSLQSLQGTNGLVIAFICNHCPYVKAIGNRLTEDAQTLKQSGINLVAINSNDFIQYPADNPENMKLFSQQYNFDFPYLVDEDQSIARNFGAVCTPEFFGLDRAGVLRYQGRLDDVRMNDATERTPDLINAMREIADTGSTQVEQVASMGCSIKWK